MRNTVNTESIFRRITRKFFPDNSIKQSKKLKKDLLALKERIFAGTKEDEARSWENKIEAIYAMQDLGKKIAFCEESRVKSALERKYALWDKELFGVKGAKTVRDLLLSEDEVDRTRILHLLEKKIDYVRSIVEVARAIEENHRKTAHFVQKMKEQRILDKVASLIAFKEKQEEQLQSAKTASADLSYIGILENHLHITENQLEPIYSSIEKEYVPFYEKGLEELHCLSLEEAQDFLSYIKKKKSKKTDELIAIKEIQTVLSHRLIGDTSYHPAGVNLNFLRVATNLLRGFLCKEIEKSFSLRQAA